MSQFSEFFPNQGFYLILNLNDDRQEGEIIVAIDKTQYPHARKGKILAVGQPKKEDKKIIYPDYRDNDIVLYKSWGFEEIILQGKKCHVVKFEDVLGKFLS